MVDPGVISFSSDQIVKVLCSTVGALGIITAAAIKLLYNNLLKQFTARFDEIQKKMNLLQIRQHNMMRSVFALITRLNPDKTSIIVEVMEQTFVDSVAPPTETNGAAVKSSWKS